MNPSARSANKNSIYWIGLLIAISFISGAAFFKFKPFPYHQISATVLKAKKAWIRQSIDPSAVIANQYSRESSESLSIRRIDTGLLPLEITTITLGTTQLFPKGGGSITMVNGSLVLMDRLGGFYVLKSGELVSHNLPPLPNNINEFILSLHAPLSAGTLKVHDIEYIPEDSALAVSFERFNIDKGLPQLAVALIKINPTDLSLAGDWKTIFISDVMPEPRYAGQAGGGRIVAKGAGKLLVTVGDYNQDGVMAKSGRVAQDAALAFGKIFEVDCYTLQARIVSMGHRNPQGLLVTADGKVFSTEHGPAGGDELNHIRDGANFGWPEVTLGTDYGVYDWPHSKSHGSHAGFASPLFAWIPSVGVSNLIQVRDFDQRWNGDLLVGSLKATSLFRLRLDENSVIYSEAIWIGERIRDIVQMKSGTIAAWTDNAHLLMIEIDRTKLQKNQRGLGYLGQPELALCMNCHHFDITGPTHLAPSLNNIVGRKIASDNFPRYSPALKEFQGSWTPDNLKKFISSPESFAPGSTMPNLGLPRETVDAIVVLLANQVK